MSQEEIGAYSNLVSWVGIISILATLELSSSIYNARFDYSKEELKKYISTLLLFGTIVTAVEFILVIVFARDIENFTGIKRSYIIIVFCYLLVYPAVTIYTVKMQAFLEYKKSIFISGVLTISTVLISVALILYLPNRLDGRVIGTYLPATIISLVLYFSFVKTGKSFDKRYIKYSVAISIPLMFHLLAGALLGSSDRIMITQICGNVDNALYSTAYNFSILASLIWSSINNAFAPWSFELLDRHEESKLKIPSIKLLAAFSILLIIMSFLAPEGLLLLGGKSYIPAAKVVPPVLCGSIIFASYTFYVNVEQFYKKQKYIAFATTLAALANIILNIFLLPNYGYVAAAYTTLLGYLLMYMIHYIVTRMILKQVIYDDLLIFAIVGGSSFIVLLAQLLYNYYLIRYIVVFFLIVIMMILCGVTKKKNLGI